MKAIKISILLVLTILAIVLLVCSCKKFILWIATKAFAFLILFVITKLWKAWDADTMFAKLIEY